MEKHRIEHCHSITNEQAELEDNFVSSHIDKNNRMPTFLDAIEYGMSLQREQMMRDATEAFITRNRYTRLNVLSGLDRTCKAIQGFKDGNKLKVIFIKED